MNLARIKAMADAAGGWMNDAEGLLLYQLARKCSGKGVIVEIGSWKGRSTIWLGHGSRDGRRVKIHAVDPHTGSPEHQGDVVNAAREFNEPIEFIFIDGLHDYGSVKADFEAWFPKVIEGGIMAFHDTTGWPGPRRLVAEQLFKSQRFRKVRFVRSITYGEKTAPNTAPERLANRLTLRLFLSYAFVYRQLWRMKHNWTRKIPALPPKPV